MAVLNRLLVFYHSEEQLRKTVQRKTKQGKYRLFPYLIYRRILLQIKTKRLRKKSINSRVFP